MTRIRNMSAFGVSIIVHAAILCTLAVFQISADNDIPDILLETVFTEERVQEEFSRELQETIEIATDLNPVSSGALSAAIGQTGGPATPQVRMETSDSLKDPQIEVNVGDITLPAEALLTEDLGEGQVAGETGAAVEGYGAALGRLTQELIRMMREQRVLVVWLFDQSHSMKDDQLEVAQRFDKVYQELGLAKERDTRIRADKEILLTSVWGYGEKYIDLTKQPTADIAQIMKAIENIPVDESGKENMCQTIREAIKKYRVLAQRQKRKLVIVVVSDESGDDGQYVEDAITEARQARAPIYVLGRESVFGYPYARQRWIDPEFKLSHWLRINRGPETAFPECLQWDGLRNRWDVYNAGFGPYEMVRMCRESGGIFFILPGEEEDLSGPGAHERRKFAFLAMKRYQPLLLPRKVYAEEVKNSPFRRQLWDVISTLNPNENPLLPKHDPQLNIRQHHYPIANDEFRQEAAAQVVRAARAMAMLNQVIPVIEELQPLRAREASQRWRANYDLIYAQLLSYRVRLFQFLLAMDRHANTGPQPSKEKSNVWNVRRTRGMIQPDEAQFARIKEAFKVTVSMEEYLQVLKDQEERSKELYELVKKQHAGTPWARRAEHEMNVGFGMEFVEGFLDPKYRLVGTKIKLPNL